MLMEKEIDNFLKEQAGPRNVPRDLWVLQLFLEKVDIQLHLGGS